MKKIFKSKKSVVIVSLSAFVVLCVGLTFALLNSTAKQVENEFKSAKINVQVVEDKGTSQTYDDVKYYGDNYNKSVKVENLVLDDYQTTDTLVRVKLVPVLRDKATDANLGSTEVSYEQGENWNDWVMHQGYYYYKFPLAAGAVTGELISGVKLEEDLPDNTYLEIQVLTDAVQARPYISPTVLQTKTAAYQAWQVYLDTWTSNNLKKK